MDKNLHFNHFCHVILIPMLHVEGHQEMLRIILGIHFRVIVYCGKPKRYGRGLHQRYMVKIVVDVERWFVKGRFVDGGGENGSRVGGPSSTPNVCIIVESSIVVAKDGFRVGGLSSMSNVNSSVDWSKEGSRVGGPSTKDCFKEKKFIY